jgi:RimJ/RimL family protein N-acetyltransferase
VPGRGAADELRTARLWLRRWRAQDEGPMAAINEDREVTRYLNRSVDRAATAAFYAGVQEHWAEHGFGFYAVESVADGPGAGFIGFVGIAHPTFVPELAARPELGWRAAPGGGGWRPRPRGPSVTMRSSGSPCMSSSRSSTRTTLARSASRRSSG